MRHLARSIVHQGWNHRGTATTGGSLILLSFYAYEQQKEFNTVAQSEPSSLLYQQHSIQINTHPTTKQQQTSNTTSTTTAATAPPPHPNARISMEDEYCIRDNCFYAIFDGHGGGGVSRYLKHHLYDTILSYQRNHHSISNALTYAFRDIETTIEKDEALKYQGSTATAIYITEHELISANIGDSRAVLSRNRSSHNLTMDHKPLAEKERILKLGEKITWDRFSKVHRIRNLSVSRAMGDVYAKPVVSSEIDIKHFARDDTDEFIIIATDGLWDVMESSEAVDYCHDVLDKTCTAEARLVLKRHMAHHLTQEAVRRGSGDNVCVVMIWLNE